MFDNIGSKIKTLAKVVCWIGIIASVIGGAVLWTTTTRVYSGSGYYSSYKTVHPYVWQGFVVLIAGCLVSWISTWMLYAFGQLVENSDEQVRQNETLYKQNEEMLKQLKKMNGETEPSKPAPAKTSTSTYRRPSAGEWSCPDCGTINPAYATFCKKCLTEKKKD